jgi:hypothetical protein
LSVLQNTQKLCRPSPLTHRRRGTRNFVHVVSLSITTRHCTDTRRQPRHSELRPSQKVSTRFINDSGKKRVGAADTSSMGCLPALPPSSSGDAVVATDVAPETGIVADSCSSSPPFPSVAQAALMLAEEQCCCLVLDDPAELELANCGWRKMLSNSPESMLKSEPTSESSWFDELLSGSSVLLLAEEQTRLSSSGSPLVGLIPCSTPNFLASCLFVWVLAGRRPVAIMPVITWGNPTTSSAFSSSSSIILRTRSMWDFAVVTDQGMFAHTCGSMICHARYTFFCHARSALAESPPTFLIAVRNATVFAVSELGALGPLDELDELGVAFTDVAPETGIVADATASDSVLLLAILSTKLPSSDPT